MEVLILNETHLNSYKIMAIYGEGLKFHYFKPFWQLVVFRGLINREINFFCSTDNTRFGRLSYEGVTLIYETSRALSVYGC